MVDDNVFRANGGEAVTAEIAYAFGEARRVGREQQVRPIVHDELLEVHHAEQAGLHADLLAVRVHAVRHQIHQRFRHVRVHRQVYDRAAAAPFQRRFVHANQILGFFLELDVGVAYQAEQALPVDVEAGEHALQE